MNATKDEQDWKMPAQSRRMTSGRSDRTIRAHDPQEHSRSKHDTYSVSSCKPRERMTETRGTFDQRIMTSMSTDRTLAGTFTSCKESFSPSATIKVQDQSPIYRQVIAPSLEALRRQAKGYPVALKSISKLEACLLEVEEETTGLVDTFVVTMMNTAEEAQRGA